MSKNTRGGALAAFARMTLKEERRKCPPKPGEEGPWLTGARQEQHRAAQLEYARPYQAEYLSRNRPVQPEELFEESEISSEVCASEVSSMLEDACKDMGRNDIMSSLAAVRSRRMRGPQSSAASNVSSVAQSSARSLIDFEKTSTVLPPPIVTIDAEDVKATMEDIKKQYFSNYQTNSQLPIHAFKSNVVNSIVSYSVTLIEGATGCGKTTQVPTYILEHSLTVKRADRVPLIYVTQPRKIAAKSIAQRVCNEHDWELGGLVGYQVGLNKCTGPETRLVFCTAGVLLQKLISEKSLQSFSHIIVDEAHERDADTDLLLMMIRTLMRREKSSFRLIVMSATMDMDKLKSYFTFRTSYGHMNLIIPSICKVDNRNRSTNVQIIYYDKLRASFALEDPLPEFEIEQPMLYDESLRGAAKIILDVIPKLDTFSEQSKSTLVFLPGLAEICKLHGMLRRGEDTIDIIPLHSCIAYHDQLMVFEPARAGRRKVILATNIAESSITVTDVGFIVDFCLTKVLMKDEITRFPVLKLQWSSRDKSIQRAGRTGRCCPGKVFRMVSQKFFQEFNHFATPELLIAPLELSVLRTKSFNMGQVKALLAVVLDPPPMNEIRTAILELKQIGALSGSFEGKYTDEDGDLTELGKIITNLPIDVHLSKLIVLASAFDVIEDAIIIAACLSTNRTVVKHLYGRLLESYDNKLKWANGSYSDLFVSLDVYKEFNYYKDEQNKSQSWLDTYCQKKKLDERKLFEVSSLVDELRARLDQLNIQILPQPNRVRNKYEDEFMLKVAFCAAFYPSYFLSQDIDPEIVRRDVCGFDPAKTVILHNIPVNHVPLYYQQIMDHFKTVITGKIEFIADVSRALLIIESDERMISDDSTSKATGINDIIQLTQGVPKAIYRAIKHGEAERLEIRQYTDEAAFDRMQPYLNARRQFSSLNRLPPPWLRVVGDREADNLRLLEATDEEYETITRNNYALEVTFQHHQELADQSEVKRILDAERRNDKDGMESQIFTRIPKWVRGPTSPIRVTFGSVLEKSKGFNVDVDPLSVNSILLDPRYEEKERQLLVAASVTQTAQRNRVIARDTTLMPKISGLTELMALLFSPERRLKFKEGGKLLDSCVFGIGWKDDGKPIDKDYEVRLDVEVEINEEDLELIDQARNRVKKLTDLLTVRNVGLPRGELQEQLREIVLALIRKRRALV